MKSSTFPILSASSIMDDPVRNRKDEDLGSISELMIDTRSGEIVYAVLSFGGMFGMGDKLFAIPWQAFDVDTTNECLVLEVDQAELEEAPGFDEDNWPSQPDNDFINRVHTHYGYEPYYDEVGNVRSREARRTTSPTRGVSP